jgi:UDP-N-acetylglucosamine:LPS N-acetylglucosamine transferase
MPQTELSAQALARVLEQLGAAPGRLSTMAAAARAAAAPGATGAVADVCEELAHGA